MRQITDYLRENKEYKQIYKCFTEQRSARKPLPMTVTGMCEGARSAFCRAIIEDYRRDGGGAMLIIAPDEKTANRINDILSLTLTGAVYNYRDYMFHNIVSSHEFEHERLFALCGILDDRLDYVVTTADAMLQYTIPADTLESLRRRLEPGTVCDIEELTALLCDIGYARVDTVESKGQFSVRGGILDIFSTDMESPVRMEFFGDEIDTITAFDIMTQRRGEPVDIVELTPSREIVVTEEARKKLETLIEAQAKKQNDFSKKEVFAEELEVIRGTKELHFADKYISVIYPERETLLDYLGINIPYILIEENATAKRLEAYDWQLNATVTELLASGVDKKICDYGKWKQDFEVKLSTSGGILCDNFLTSSGGGKRSGIFNFITKQTSSYFDKYDLLFEDLLSYLRGDYRVIITCENKAEIKQIVSALDENNITALTETDPEYGKPLVICNENLPGFELSGAKFVTLTTLRGFDRAKTKLQKAKKKHKKKDGRESIMSYADLNVGDFVVHENHGIGQYLGLQSLTVEGVRRDFVKIKYQGKDMLYLPCDQLDSIAKYIGAGADDGTVKLSKMGGNDWIKAKAKAKKAATDMAKELIQLYAQRLKQKGYAFSEDDDFQRQFEDEFEYEETDGQLIAAEEIKRDMENECPMDRLLCGDVGFGKTEVAMRAAFKAVNNSKQVAVLVPTTILAMQHYQTISSRMRGFPIKVDMLSRFRTPKQQAETVRKLRRGEVDIIVGTHRMISKDVVFKDLGLVIVDEEQRFGVAQKEKLKQIAKNVDVLTLTATPIPRTLNMAMSGIRDMSVLEEAPNERMPVQSYVLEYDDTIIAEAINKELRRGGQVFYLYNRVENINNIAARVSSMAPDAKVAVAHGQMDKDDMSAIWEQMVTGEVDILVSTTIIETGVDIPNANTLIIENSDKMGLSQLHQIRGRIGRSNRRAYAYFTYPRGKVLSEISEKRLSAVRDYTEFGSGFKIALRDLEIRGAGNLLGSEQHGNIESVGYDLYIKILNNAILEEKGELIPEKPECTVDIKVNAYIPEAYITSSAQRIEAYKKIASIENEDDFWDITDELLDRYGDIPEFCDNLLRVSYIRALGRSCGLSKIVMSGQSMLFYSDNIDVRVWTDLAADNKGKILLNLSSRPYATYRLQGEKKPLSKTIGILSKYLQYKNSQEKENEKQS
ncbi:MAG: transcription-repair coupling factor [Ruminococcaceae bacterium]|nr:transcription-repair coupling factor [Oscillospiraceae bacterium]